MEKVIKSANNVWKFVVGLTTLITLVYGSYQAYKYYATPNISGEWYLTLTTKSSTKRSYVGDVIGIKAYFTQVENGVTGYGEKWEYRGEKLGYKQHRRLEFIGSLDGKLFKTNYILHGLLRETSGIMEVEIVEGGRKMIGTFSGTAADTKGTMVAMKQSD